MNFYALTGLILFLSKFNPIMHCYLLIFCGDTSGFKAFHSAKATIDGIETAHMIRKGQLSDENIPAYKQFMALAG
jgi:hypothetical protein